MGIPLRMTYKNHYDIATMVFNHMQWPWKARSQMDIISWFPLGVRCFSRGGCILVSFLQLISQFMPKKEKKRILLVNGHCFENRIRSYWGFLFWHLFPHFESLLANPFVKVRLNMYVKSSLELLDRN